mgnify:CR=1 FL=1|jgi:hypothetical protein|tara:strand:+ start:1001 stop:1522 length:522 start_codon:yes stop_codon:yes gene_type:complete
MTKLNKQVNREVTINGEDFIASLSINLNEEPEFTLRKKRHKHTVSVPMHSLMDDEGEVVGNGVALETGEAHPKAKATLAEIGLDMPCSNSKVRKTHTNSMMSDPEFAVSEIKSKLAVSEMEYKLKVEVLKAINSLFEVECALNAPEGDVIFPMQSSLEPQEGDAPDASRTLTP